VAYLLCLSCCCLVCLPACLSLVVLGHLQPQLSLVDILVQPDCKFTAATYIWRVEGVEGE
jgi:hypothetical protein